MRPEDLCHVPQQLHDDICLLSRAGQRPGRATRDLRTTQRDMHLSPAAIEGAIRRLEQPNPVAARGDMLETADA